MHFGELVLCGFVICLDMGGMVSTPYTKKKGVSPVARLEDVWLVHSAHRSSSICLAPCFFKQS
jgi:hypothetical protein